MPSKARRRITLQLIPLLDLLLIVLFAQFMQLQDASQKQEVRAQQAEKQAAASVAQVTVDREELAQMRAALQREKLNVAASLSAAKGDQDRIAAMTADLLNLPAETVKKALEGKSAEDIKRLQAALAALPSPQAADIAHQLATMSELRRACDVWQIHIEDNDLIRVTFPPSTQTFRADNPAEFDRRLFEWYKSLPPSKSVVIIQVTWGDATAGTEYSVKEGLLKCVERMRSDRNGRTIFEYVILGFRPS